MGEYAAFESDNEDLPEYLLREFVNVGHDATRADVRMRNELRFVLTDRCLRDL